MPAQPGPDPSHAEPPRGGGPARSPVVGATVDLGATSVHLLVAALDGHVLTPLVDESVFLGLGRVVAERGLVGRTTRAGLVRELERYAETARSRGAEAIQFLGTEPIRRAADAAAVVHDIVRATGVPTYVLTHEEEAFLTIVGVMSGLPVRQETLVVDIGGGSSEFCVVDPVAPPRAVGLRLGAASVTDSAVRQDPPTAVEIADIEAAANLALAGAPAAQPGEVVAVGGTASNLLKLGDVADPWLTRDRIGEALAALAREPAASVAERFEINPQRARILPGGAAILLAVMTRYGVDRIRVSDAGLREGSILALAHARWAWRDRLPELAHGWRT